jgi:hypothetical protein
MDAVVQTIPPCSLSVPLQAKYRAVTGSCLPALACGGETRTQYVSSLSDWRRYLRTTRVQVPALIFGLGRLALEWVSTGQSFVK